MIPANRLFLTTIFSAALLMAAPAPAATPHDQHASASPLASGGKLAETSAALRDLWIGHVFWVRNVVVDTVNGNTASAKASESAVVANAKAIAAAIEPFYGKEASEKLFTLLAGHYGAIKRYLEATNARNQAAQEVAMKELTGNAADIAKFLSDANPHLPYATLHGLLLAHGGHHVQEIQQLQQKQYAQEAQTWEAMKTHMYVIADAMAGALAKQFPARFA